MTTGSGHSQLTFKNNSLLNTRAVCKVRGLTYYSESELCGGAVTVSFSKYLPWQAMHFLTTLHPLLENVLQTVDHFEISCLGAPFS
jgi:hypothetical protein